MQDFLSLLYFIQILDICWKTIRDFLYHHMMQLQKPEDFKTSGSKINMLGHVKVLSLTYFSGPCQIL